MSNGTNPAAGNGRKDPPMRIASTEALYSPVVFRTDFVPASPRAAHQAEAVLAQSRADEAPDPSFWTAYDYFMLEREARAVRRAFIFSLVVGWARKLRGAPH